MQRTGLKANILSSPSIEFNSACLNFTELQRGHSCFVQIKCGNQSGPCRFAEFICNSFQEDYNASAFSLLECDSSHRSIERILPVAMAIQESAAP
jgi:hypothetical protein